MSGPILETRGLGKDYGAVTALVGLDLEVAGGELFGLLGPNGAGKTTAISMIAGVVGATRGTARIAGHEVRGAPFAARAALGLVPQDLALYEELTPRQNLRFFGGLHGLRGSELAARIDWALGLAGLADRAGDRVASFSGGMKRRLNLVVGLLHRPRLVILDEPTVGVDPQSRNFILQAIRSLCAEHGMTVLYTSHYIEEVEALCPRVAILDHGRLIAEGTVDELVARHGVGAREVEFRGPTEVVCETLSRHGEVVITAGERGRAVLRCEVSIGVLVRALEDVGVEVLAARAERASLETVFLGLTGHSLRDA
jgi:ABC-2 type transport system ATP-binding protein